MMTRKNYRAFAAVVREHLDDTRDVTARRAVASLARGLALEFRADNAHFRFDTFYAACGLNEWGHLPEPPALAQLAEGVSLMTKTVTYTRVPDADGIYLVHDRLTARASIGRVARVGRRWCAIPSGEQAGDRRRLLFTTRDEAAYRLARYTDEDDPAWIAEEED